MRFALCVMTDCLMPDKPEHQERFVARYFPDIKHMCGDAEQRTYIVKFFAR
jgi:hypothetical protein